MLVVPPHYLDRNIASSIALYTYLARSVDICKSDLSMEFFVSSLCKLVPRVCSHICRAGAIVELNADAGSICISRDGQVAGFKGCMLQGVHNAVPRVLSAEP